MAYADKIFTDNEDALRKALTAVELEVSRLIGQLNVDSKGNIKNTKDNIVRARNMRREIIKAMNALDPGITGTVNAMTKIPAHVKQVFKAAEVSIGFSEADQVMLESFMTATAGDMSAAVAQWAGEVSNAIYIAAVANTPYEAVLTEVAQLLKGGTDARGRPLLHYLVTIVNTRFAEVDTTLMMIKGEEIGVEKWRYVGTSITDSRDWCVNHMNKVYTKEEIQAWSKREWAGKKAGDPFITRGGWNCRHSWSPVIE